MATEVTDSVNFYKVWAWYEAHRKQVNLGAVLVAAAALVIWFVLWRQEENQTQAGDAFSKVAVTQMTSPNAPQIPENYLKVAGNFQSSQAGAHALLLAAAGYFDEGKYADARTQFERFRREYHDSPLSGVALLGMAACLDAEGKTNDAINAYRDLVEHHPNDVTVLPQAKFALGRLYEAQNQPQMARTYFEEAARTDSYGSIGSEAGMRFEELKRKYPQLAPTTPLPTNGPTFNIQKQ